MPDQKQITRLVKLYSFYEEKPKEFLDETDVDSNFYHNNFDIFQSKHRIANFSHAYGQ